MPKVDDSLLREIVRRIVAKGSPQKIILFGSGARDQLGPTSDIDILVVKDVPHRRNYAMEIYPCLRGLEVGVDVVVATPEDLIRFRDSPTLVIGQALKEGRVLYDAA